ncbi:MAG: flavodoxin family protein [Candidatus Hodarchaeota archaeon]
MKVLIVYYTKYGNTEKVANLIAEGIISIEGNEVVVNNVKDVKLKKENSYDLLLIGSPAHFGKHVGSIKKFINKLPTSQLKVKAYAVFDTYIKTDFEMAVKKMEEQISEMMPALIKASPGLSIKVEGMKGPITEEDLPKCKEFGIKLAQGAK